MPNLIFIFPKSNNSTLNGINIKKLRKSGLTELVNKDRKLLFKKTIDVCISFIGRNSGNQNYFIAGLD